MVDCDGLGKRFGDVVAMEDVGFAVDAGEIFALLGPNGAGKTTTLRVLATLVRADVGTATVAGYDVARAPEEVRRRIGVVNGGMGLYDRLTGRETLHWFGALYGMRRNEVEAGIERLDAVLDLQHTLDRRCGDFSSGMKQKIVIARAVLHDPPVLFFDEATSGLDVLARRAVLDFARGYPGEGRAVVWSTHVMSEVEELCDRVGVLYRGRWIDEGTVAELRARADDAPDLERAFFRLVQRAGVAEAPA
ncbi:MAG: ATP-binding cassette domain-containing protein [Trueperaceae bacterium]|nr:ATP-binding cassette domain-containing protein [Trueperaceae bacterium]